MKLLISLFWLVIVSKKLLLWLYIWQLKEYRVDRFLDYFRTEKGKKLIVNKINSIKFFLIPSLIFLGVAWWWSPIFLVILFFLYLFETFLTLKNFCQKNIRCPVLTKKTLIILTIGFSFEISILFSLFQLSAIKFFALLLGLDILAPLFFSVLVLSFQPLTSVFKNQIIKKAKEKRTKFKDLLVVGITGSYGKTSTKEFLSSILEEKFKILKTLEHQNTDPGIAQCIIDNLTSEHQIFIVEMAAYRLGEIKPPCQMVQPKIGILTGINAQHLALFGSQGNIVKTKYELIEFLPQNGLAIFNGDNEYCLNLYKKTNKPKKIYSLKKEIDRIKTDIWAEDIKVEKESIFFKAFSIDGDFADFKVNLLGSFNVLNILGAVCLAKELNMSLEEISQACQKIKPVKGAMRLLKSKNSLNIIDATYSANPDGVISHLEYLKIWESKKVIVMPCLIELGKASKEVHKRIGQKIGEVCDLTIITTKEYFKEIKEGAIEKGMKTENILFIENPKEIFEKIKSFCQEGDVVLLESRVPESLIKQLSIG